MVDIAFITLIGTLAGVLGTGLGGFLIVLLGNLQDIMLSWVLAFSAGIMLAVVFVGLLPEALQFGGFTPALIGVLLGVGLLVVLDLYLPHTHFSCYSKGEDRKSRFLRASVLLGLGIAMHNLPEGLAIGAGFIAAESLGFSLAVAIGIQNIPEGMAMAGPMKACHLDNHQILLWTGLAGLPMGVGALGGAVLGGVSPLVLAGALGFAAGAMLYVVFDELLPDAHSLARGHVATFGAVAGVVFALFILLIF